MKRNTDSGRPNNTTRQTAPKFWKLLTHDFRSPIQGGDVLFDGKTFPFKLNGTTLDKSDVECGSGWNFVDSIETGFKIVGMWKTGRPSQILVVHPSEDKIQRGNKWRASQLTIERFATTLEIEAAIERFSEVFGAYKSEMAREQILWREALSRPLRDINKVTESLEIALKKRGLDWKLQEFDSAQTAWDAQTAWAAWDAWDAWAAQTAWDAWAARDAWAAWDARAAQTTQTAWDAWAARDAWAAWDARDARDARDALTVNYASLNKWITNPSNLLTAGIRDAFINGLEIAVSTSKETLGFSMNP